MTSRDLLFSLASKTYVLVFFVKRQDAFSALSIYLWLIRTDNAAATDVWEETVAALARVEGANGVLYVCSAVLVGAAVVAEAPAHYDWS